MSLPPAIAQPDGSEIAEEIDNGLAGLDPATELEYFTLDFITLTRMSGSAISDFLHSGVVQTALHLAGFQVAYLVRFELGPLESFTIPGISVPIGDQVYTSPFAGQVLDGGWRNWLVGMSVRS